MGIFSVGAGDRNPPPRFQQAQQEADGQDGQEVRPDLEEEGVPQQHEVWNHEVEGGEDHDDNAAVIRAREFLLQ